MKKQKCSSCKYFFIEEKDIYKNLYNALTGTYQQFLVEKAENPACGLNPGIIYLSVASPKCVSYDLG